MFYLDEFDTKKIIEIIESVDDSFKYSSVELFKKAMMSVGFVVRTLKKYENYGNLYSCRGKINQHTIYLDIYEKVKNDSICVSMKRYFNEFSFSNRVKRFAHRENDLPAVILYDERSGKVTDMRYFIDGKACRKEEKPVHIMYTYNQDDEISSTYFKFVCESYLDNFINFSLYEITYTNNLIVDCSFCYNNELLSFKEIALILPDLDLTDLNSLLNFKRTITKEQLKLIEIYFT